MRKLVVPLLVVMAMGCASLNTAEKQVYALKGAYSIYAEKVVKMRVAGEIDDNAWDKIQAANEAVETYDDAADQLIKLVDALILMKEAAHED